MEGASEAFTKWFTKYYNKIKSVAIVCGTGNNGGDGLAVARMLSEIEYTVSVYILGEPEKGSDDFQQNLKKLGLEANQVEDSPTFNSDIIIDAVFGTGLSRPPEGKYAKIINAINESEAEVVSIDLPSGLYANEPLEKDQVVVKAKHTVTFELPKLSFLLPTGGAFVNYWQAVPIGLNPDFPYTQAVQNYYVTSQFIAEHWRPRSKWSHKGENGKALLIAGSYGKMGACVLSAQACLRAGIGLLSLHIPACGYSVVQTAVPEAMAAPDASEKHFSQKPDKLDSYTVLGIGPGLGTYPDSAKALEETLNAWTGPLVLDADALNILSKNPQLLKLLPKNTILTPHPKELERLVGEVNNDFDRLEKQRQFAQKHNVVLVVKGAHTSITRPDGLTFFNSTGNPALATGGTGDVLTGIILALLGQGYEAWLAATLGVYLGGRAADLWTETHGPAGMIAGDIPHFLPKAMKEIGG